VDVVGVGGLFSAAACLGQGAGRGEESREQGKFILKVQPVSTNDLTPTPTLDVSRDQLIHESLTALTLLLLTQKKCIHD